MKSSLSTIFHALPCGLVWREIAILDIRWTGNDSLQEIETTPNKAYHPCDDVRITWICEHVVQPGREVGARLFMFRNFSTLLKVAREILVGVVDVPPSVVGGIIIMPSFLGHTVHFEVVVLCGWLRQEERGRLNSSLI